MDGKGTLHRPYDGRRAPLFLKEGLHTSFELGALSRHHPIEWRKAT